MGSCCEKQTTFSSYYIYLDIVSGKTLDESMYLNPPPTSDEQEVLLNICSDLSKEAQEIISLNCSF